MLAKARGEMNGKFFMQVQSNYMRKRRVVTGGGSATPDQWVTRPGRPLFDLQQEIPMVNNE